MRDRVEGRVGGAAAPARCAVVLPCKDEGPALPGVLARLPAGMRAIVVDNGSVDDTAEVARRLGATVVHEAAPGYGAAVHAGVLAATAPLLGVIDGDGSLDPGDLVRLADLVESGEATMAVGRRQPTDTRAWPWHARYGNQLVCARVRQVTGLPVHDIAPIRVCRTRDLLDLGVEDRRFGYPLELLLRAGRAGWTVIEVDVAYARRAEGTRSKVSGSVRGTVRAMRDFAAVLS
ncbi:glycosyltransferase family 2 protein [soil metagenome]